MASTRTYIFMLPKIAIVTTAAPPSASGQARVLAQLLDVEAVAPPVFLTDRLADVEANGARIGRYVQLSQPRFRLIQKNLTGVLGTLNNWAGLMASVLTRSREITEALRGENITVMVGCSGNPFDLPAAYLAARKLGIPFIAYLFDDPVFQWGDRIYRSFARFWERIWGRGSALVIGPNEVLLGDIRSRLPNAELCIVRNPVGPAAFASAGSSVAFAQETGLDAGPRKLLYSGSVYLAQGSAFRNLVAALAQLDGRFQLDVYTAQSQADLEANGVNGPHVVHHAHVAQEKILALQQRADLLFLPLAFASVIPEVVLSSAPAKLAEYLAAGRPILAHAPRGSFVSEILKKHQAAYVVDEADPALLVQALNTMEQDPVLCRRMVANARNLAAEFHVDRAREAFKAALLRAKGSA